MTVADLLWRCDSAELTQWQVLFEVKHDEHLFFHEHPHSTYDDYLQARDEREQHARQAGHADRDPDDEDEDDLTDDEDEAR
jgi:hypothetical protein